MRRVIYSAYVSIPNGTGSGRAVWDLQEQGEANFHQFGVGYEEFESGPGNYTTAILELDDGTIKNVPVEHVKFIVEPVKELFGGVNDALSKLTIRG